MIKDAAIAAAYAAYNILAPRLPAGMVLPRDPFRCLEEFFDAIWVLTIPRNRSRQESIQRQFSGLNLEFVSGVDGRNLGPDDRRIDMETACRINRRSVRVNELACTMSHLQMYEKMLQLGLERVLIFEDDAFYITRRGRWIPYCLARLPGDWELFYMGYRLGELRGFQREFLEKLGRRQASRPVFSRSVGRGVRTAAKHDFTHAYAVTREGARKLLEGAYPVSHTADGWLAHKVASGQLHAFISIPKIFSQKSESGSSIHAR